MRKSLTSVFAVALALTATAALAQNQEAQLNPVKERISDQAINADLATYEQVQARLKAINEGGRPLRDYHLSKAQCWLDVSFHEYTRNDRSSFPQEALDESTKLAKGMEQDLTNLPSDTALVNGAAKLRPDLWDRVAKLKSHPQFACAQQQAACAEVELVHAGNEFNQQQWRHAQPYVQIAEDWVAKGEQSAQQCADTQKAALAAAAVPAPVPVPAPAPRVVQLPAPTELSFANTKGIDYFANIVFNFDKYQAQDIRPFSRDSLQRLINEAKSGTTKIEKIRVVGHADKFNRTGHKDYNADLSRKRALTVQQLLVDAGLPKATISYEYHGDTEPVVQCDGKLSSHFEAEECQLPNRRVEVMVIGTFPR